jgi:hypothetical protein
MFLFLFIDIFESAKIIKRLDLGLTKSSLKTIKSRKKKTMRRFNPRIVYFR